MAAFGHMAQISSVLTNAQQQQQPGAPVMPGTPALQPGAMHAGTPRPAQAPGQPLSEPAVELIKAVTELIETKNAPKGNDSRLTECLTRLNEMVGQPGAQKDFKIEEDPNFLRLKAEMEQLRATVTNHGRQLDTLQQTTSAISEDSRATRQMMEELMRRQSAGPAAQAGQGGLPRASGAAAALPGGAPPPGGPAGAAFPDPAFQNTIDEEFSSTILPMLGVGVATQAIKEFLLALQSREQGEVSFQEWWDTISKRKSLSQWRTKAAALGAKPAEVANLPMTKFGEMLFARLTADGEWHSEDLQRIVLQ